MRSMTGFGRGAFEVDSNAYRLEIRTVNNRFLDLRIHMPWTDGELEQRLRSAVRGRLSRGRVELTIDSAAGDAKHIRLDRELAADLAHALGELAELVGCDVPTASRLLPPQRELLSNSARVEGDALWRGIEPCLVQALDRLLEMRAREGSALRADLDGYVASLRVLVDQITELVAGEPDRRAQRMRERVDRLVAEANVSAAGAIGDPDALAARLAQEIALLADRGDVSEELARLDSHLAQLAEMLDVEDAVGRRLEFMLQEVNRELNTIASKSSEARVAALVVDGKGVLEKMREQAQNVE